MLLLGENLNCARFLGCIVYVVLLISWSSRGRLAHTPTTPKKKHKNKRKARGRAPGNGEQYCTQVENSRRGSRPRQNLAALTLARGLRPERRSRLPSKTTLLGDPLACQTAKGGGRTRVLIVMASCTVTTRTCVWQRAAGDEIVETPGKRSGEETASLNKLRPAA
jgi:hypothetical protein